MKNCLLFFISFFIYTSLCQAQDPTLWGMTTTGGSYYGGTNSTGGTIFSYDIATGTRTNRHFFGRITDGLLPYGTLMQSGNGLLYGMTSEGGNGNVGTIFQYDFSTGKDTILHEFINETDGQQIDGQHPKGSLIQAGNGLLYAMTSDGGVYDFGTIFSYNITTGTETDLHNFGIDSDGTYPQGSLIQASNGLLYGMTETGGIKDSGVIFSYNISTGAETAVHNFSDDSDGYFPFGSLIQASNGLLYGMTSSGGKYNGGIIFSYEISSGTETDLHDFSTDSGGYSLQGSLILVSDSLLYGMTIAGGTNDSGVIFSYNISTGIETDLHNFGSGTDGKIPYGSLIQASNGLLYGMTEKGGLNEAGVIFSYNISNGTESDVHNFGNDTDGRNPYGSLIQASNGLLYGMTATGGVYTWGTIFSCDISKDTEIHVHDFGSGTDGNSPYGSLLRASNGLLYGMTTRGGDYFEGTIFSYDISKDTETDIHDFDKATNGQSPYGAAPYGSLIQANNGLLYGMTQFGGVFGYGVIFSYDIFTGKETDLHDFGNSSDGAAPIGGSLIQASNGLLYGMTFYGGSYNQGTIFNYNISTGLESKLYDFGNGTDGHYPRGSLIQASNGLLYGVTEFGGINNIGVIFSYNISTGTEIKLHDFGSGTDGGDPFSSLIQASDGLLYGTTEVDGVNHFGIIFSYNISTGTETDVHDFSGGSDGDAPLGSLIQASNDLLYGMTVTGGTHNDGMIFSYDISTGKETNVSNFGNGITDGLIPFANLIEAGIPMGVKYPPGSADNIQLYPNPSSAYTYLNLKFQQERTVNLSLYNTLGQQVWTEDLKKIKLATTTIPLAGLANGVYILNVNSDGKSQQKKVVVER